MDKNKNKCSTGVCERADSVFGLLNENSGRSLIRGLLIFGLIVLLVSGVTAVTFMDVYYLFIGDEERSCQELCSSFDEHSHAKSEHKRYDYPLGTFCTCVCNEGYRVELSKSSGGPNIFGGTKHFECVPIRCAEKPNGSCDAGENCATCFDDCPCGEGEICDPSDSNANAWGCVTITPPPDCPNTVCDSGENCATCFDDCPCGEGEICDPSDSNANAWGCVAVAVTDSDGDGVPDDVDECRGTPAGVAVDDKGCPVGMELTVSTDKETYSPGETVIIRGSVWDAKGGLDGATVVVDVDGTKLTATAYSTEKYKGKYECEFPLPSGITQGEYTVTATASYSGYPDVSKTTSFTVGGEIKVAFDLPEVIPIPGEVPLSITATDQDGQPLKKATAIITLVDGHKMPFLTIENDRAWLDEKGQFSTKLTTRDPAGMDYVYLTDIPLQATISVEIKDREESNTLGQTEVKRPFNLALIHGVVVDNKDLKPVTQHYPPDVLGIPTNRVFKKEKNQEGDFWVMVKPNHPSRGKSIQDIMNTGGDFALKWPVEDEIPLVYSIEDAPKPGEVLELGKVGKTPLEKIKEWYTEFGTSPRTWPDGTRDEKALTGPWSSGAANNFMCSGGHIESCQFNCVAMQYKTLWFLNNLKNKKADDENAKFLSKLKGWDYSAVIGVCPPWPQHNAVALWDRGKKWWGDTGTLPPAGSGAIILDPHGKQKPHQYSADTVLFSWTIEEGMEKMYEGNGWKPQWTKPNAKQSKNRAVAVHCPVDVLVVNSQGQRLGILPNGDKVAEFEPIDSYFWQDEKGDKQWFFALPQDTYAIELLGTGSGNFHLLTSPSGEEIHDYGDNPIAAGDQATLIMNPEGDELTLADGSKPMFEVIPLESERLALPFPAHLLLFATGGIAGLAFFALLLFLLVTRRKPAPVAPPVTQPARPVRPRGRPEEFVSRRPPGRPEGPPERLGGGKPSGPPETLD